MRERSVLMFSLLALVAPVGAQTPETPALQPVQAFEEAIDVRVVNLEAVVTDAEDVDAPDRRFSGSVLRQAGRPGSGPPGLQPLSGRRPRDRYVPGDERRRE